MATAVDPLADLALDLTENGLEFLQRSVKEMAAPNASPSNFKFAIVDLAAAVEVLMKARLVRAHWTLICADPDKATPTDVLAGSARTVTPEQAMSRLDNVAGIGMKAGGHSARVVELAKLRNRAIHFNMAGAPPAALQVSLGRGLDFVLWFLDTEFRGQAGPDVEDLVEESIDTLTTQLGQINLLVAERMNSIAADLDAAELCVECPRCAQPTLMVLLDELARCAFCLLKPVDGTECATEYAQTVLGQNEYAAITGGGSWPVHPCVSCSETSMVEGIDQLHPAPGTGQCLTASFACFSCGAVADHTALHHCSRCGELTDTGGDDGVPMCSDCWAYVLRD